MVSFSNNQNPGSLEKWLILGLRQETNKMSLDHSSARKLKKATTKSPRLMGIYPLGKEIK